MIHELKIFDIFFKDVISGKKTFEIRKKDRDFQEGDLLALNEYDDHNACYTGNSCLVYVDYILSDSDYNKDGYVTMSIKPCYVCRAESPFSMAKIAHDYSVPMIPKADEVQK